MYVAAGGSRLLGRVDTARLTFAHPHISEGLATWLGCPALQGTVQEVLDPAHVLQLVESVGDISLAQVRGGCNFIQPLVSRDKWGGFISGEGGGARPSTCAAAFQKRW